MAMTKSAPLPASVQPPATALPAQELTAQLVETLHKNGMIETDEARKRETVLGRINILTKRFVKQVGMRRGLSEELAEQAGGTIFTFGPYRLGVCEPGATIDTLCLVPRLVAREDFFLDKT
ncbi:polynucleotide adenylyltransferase [Allomyces javanicus]|nr:polynucleotide adenylyltransferase [Allomyces javanicus]